MSAVPQTRAHAAHRTLLWSLYDFANSILAIVFVIYFSQWLVVEKGFSDLGYNLILATGSIALLLTGPVLGARADASGRGMLYLRRLTWLMFVAYAATSLAVIFRPGDAWIAAACFLFANLVYQISFVFYNALLPDIAAREKLGWVSGIGQAGNWFGQIAGLILTWPFVAGTITLVGAPGRGQAFLAATLMFIVLALPFLIGFRQTAPATAAPRIDLRVVFQQHVAQFRQLLRVPGMARFLLAYFLFMDAMITIAANFAIFLQNVFNATDQQKLLLILGTLVSAAFFALAAGKLADRFGLKMALTVLLAAWAVILPLQALAPSFTTFAILQILIGGSFGAIWTVTRAIMAMLCPPDQPSFAFSFYALCERTASILGPLSWGLITTLLESLGTARYRVAIAAMAIFIAAGLLIWVKVDLPERRTPSTK